MVEQKTEAFASVRARWLYMWDEIGRYLAKL